MKVSLLAFNFFCKTLSVFIGVQYCKFDEKTSNISTVALVVNGGSQYFRKVEIWQGFPNFNLTGIYWNLFLPLEQ